MKPHAGRRIITRIVHRAALIPRREASRLTYATRKMITPMLRLAAVTIPAKANDANAG